MTGTVRIISSVHEADAGETGELDTDTITALRALIDQECRTGQRESYCADSIGQRTFEAVLTSYTAPGSESRWAVRTEDNMGTSYLDAADRATAEARYEDEVRAMADCADDQMYAWWDYTDVDGLTQCAHTYRVETRTADTEEWSTLTTGDHTLTSNGFADAAHHLLVELIPYDERVGQARVEFTPDGHQDVAAVEVVDLAELAV
ncbi:hypothetical protein BS329_15360 [Amycolatopsis coloradensis]|uniref:Uncharacterized protein n=1 Tax=Amycolatopsis coloradensis TaxID=76021 RepID=A0A1R0KU38_9PSEU|nr:hypothetical protein [Amycolatopsis coloradensis]OLZ51642.1 hypothetical protein BS329_15360 [Amycolatopsis coloradensis]